MTIEQENTQVVRSVCKVTSRSCGILVYLQEGKVVRVEGAPDSPRTKGYICTMGEIAPERLYHPNRLQYPQKRVGERGEGKWQRISWEEALDIIAEKLKTYKKRYGAESVAFAKGHREFLTDYVKRLANVFGTPNLTGIDHTCYVPTAVGSLITYGYDGVPDLGVFPQCVLWWGRRGKPPLKAGAKLIVVNTLKTEAAAIADIWLQPRPASDLAIALGMLNVIVNEQLYDKVFVDKWTIGFDKLKKHVQKYPPEKVEEITWVPAEKIAEAARIFSQVKPACIKAGNAIEDNLNSVQCARAIAIICAITGNLDVPGGVIEVEGVMNEMGGPEITLRDKLTKKQQEKKIGAEQGFLPPHPLWDLVATMPVEVHPQCLVKAILEEDPYPIKALCIFESNPLLTWSNAKEVYRAFKKLDFLMVADFVMTPTAALADIVLPVASYLEEDGIDIQKNALGFPYIQVQQKVACVCLSVWVFVRAWACLCVGPRQLLLSVVAARFGEGSFLPSSHLTIFGVFFLQNNAGASVACQAAARALDAPGSAQRMGGLVLGFGDEGAGGSEVGGGKAGDKAEEGARRKERRHLREANLAALAATKPGKDDDDPVDIAAIAKVCRF